MSERGVFAVDRGIWGHSVFKPEPFTEREAWMWLLSEAAWKPHPVRVASVQVALARGQLAHSLRFMASKWQWHESHVRRFLKRLQTDAMIAVTGDAGVTIITICNYAKYQRVSLPSDAARDAVRDAVPTQYRRKEEDKENKEYKIDDGERSTPFVTSKAKKLADEIAKIVGHNPEFLPPSWYGAAYRVQTWLNNGWQCELVLASIREQSARKRDGPPNKIEYFEKGITAAIARQNSPLPKIEPMPAKPMEATNGNRGNVIPAADRLVERVCALNRPSPSALCSGKGETSIRLLSQG